MVARPKPCTRPKPSTASFVCGLKPEDRPKAAQVVERFVNYRQANYGIHQIGIKVNIRQYARQPGDAVAYGKHGYIERDVLKTVQEKDHAQNEQKVIVAGHHVFGAKVHERHNL